MLTEAEITNELNRVEQKIQKYENHIKEIESSKRLGIFNTKDLNTFKEILSEYLKKRDELYKKLESFELAKKKSIR